MAEKIEKPQDRVTLEYIDARIAAVGDLLVQLTGQLKELLAQRAALCEQPAGFSVRAQAIDSIEAYLKEQGRPRPEAEILDAMVRWGVNAGAPNQRTHLRKSLNFHLLSQAEKQKKWPHRQASPPRLKYFGHLIGLAEWPDS
jgi:hypothetical protein